MIRKVKISKRSAIKIHNSFHICYTPREQLHNCIWHFTLGDPDDKPSVPHAHAEGLGYRLNAWTGTIYPAGNERNKTIGKLNKKELNKLHSDPKFIEFAKKQIQLYKDQYPHIDFYIPDWFKFNNCQSKLSKDDEVSDYVFIGTAIIKK
jgi:hypothetical protein